MHAVRTAFEKDGSEAVLLVDATNALNRQVALQNIRRLCPPLAPTLINTHRTPTELYVDGEVLLSQEGTTQGDPLATPSPLFPSLKESVKMSHKSGMQITLLEWVL